MNIHIHNSIIPYPSKTNYQWSLHQAKRIPPLFPTGLLTTHTGTTVGSGSPHKASHLNLQCHHVAAWWPSTSAVDPPTESFLLEFLGICSSNSFQTKCQGWSNEVQRIWIWLKLNVTTCIAMVSQSSCGVLSYIHIFCLHASAELSPLPP